MKYVPISGDDDDEWVLRSPVSVCLSVCPSGRKITDERVDGCRPNLVGMAEG